MSLLPLSSRCRACACRSFRPILEELEGRLVPSAIVRENNLGAVVGQYSADGTGLAQAVADADQDTGDTIQLPAGTYQLSDALVIGSAMTLSGADARQTIINGTPANPVFVIVAPQALVTLASMTISGGQGGIEASNTSLTLDSVRVTGNTGGADGFGHGGGIVLIDTAFPTPGSSLRVLIENSTIDTNEAGGSGGGIFIDLTAQDNVTVVNSTITGNTAEGFPGYVFGGGGISMEEGNLVLQDGTLVPRHVLILG